MKTSLRLSEYVCASIFFFSISFRLEMITTKNNSNVGNLISGAVNLHMHTMRSEKNWKVNDSHGKKCESKKAPDCGWKLKVG